ncbi:hypothetical protein [Streptococcus salivarius]|uniref:hypothetical protein n=2 Tax=Streptococcus TaxID=1301 RepID=UPI001D0742CE|nr:hypothetical protein [Streptococcus salivarius]MCB6441843.1 hypothetical protein [Streptococcus salivarius]
MFLVSALMKKNEPKKKATPPSTEQVIEDSSSEDIPKEDKYEQWRKEALATLETQTPADDADTQTVKNALKEMCSYVETVQNVTDVKPNYQNHLTITSTKMQYELVAKFMLGYKYSDAKTQVFKAKADNVRQFVLEVANPDGAKLYFCGNYVMGTTQIEVTSVHGVAEADHAEHGHD